MTANPDHPSSDMEVRYVHGSWPEPQVIIVPIAPELLPEPVMPEDNAEFVYEGWPSKGEI